jgi:hypothetical protein
MKRLLTVQELRERDGEKCLRIKNSSKFEECSLLGCNAMQSVESQPTCFHSGIMRGLFDLENGGEMSLRNVG